MNSGEILVNVFFYIVALAAVSGAVAVAISKNIVRSAFSLLVVLFGAAALYAFMRADFIFAAQMLIYVGGILVLIVFAVMLTHRITDVKLSNDSRHGPAAFFACACVLFSLVVVGVSHKWSRDVAPVTREVTLGSTGGLWQGGPTQARISLSMRQGDGTTGVIPGGTINDGNGFLVIEASALPAPYTSARIRLERKVQGTWKPEGQARDGKFKPQARFELKNQEPGEYHWSVALAGENVSSTAVPAPEFRVERGLTRPIAMALMGPYLLPFEIVSVLLLAALIGAAFLARKEVKG